MISGEREVNLIKGTINSPTTMTKNENILKLVYFPPPKSIYIYKTNEMLYVIMEKF